MPLSSSGHVPTATYRVQLHRNFTFEEAGRLAPYFKKLGISDLYLSPIFTAVPGSEHGYDVTNYSEINPELGGAEGFRRLAAALKEGGCAILVDFVPNHMGIAGVLNQWWRDVLEYGPVSRYAPFFDIQWKAEPGEDHPRVLVPMLDDHYGRVLEKGEIKLAFDSEFSLLYKQTALPIRPESYKDILGALLRRNDGSPEARKLSGLIDSVFKEENGTSSHPGVPEAASALKVRFGSAIGDNPATRKSLSAALNGINGDLGKPGSFDALDQVIEQQHYRIARWQAGAHEINYRRFFAIDTLVGLHMENAEVFRQCHGLVAALLRSGDVCGLRIDHIDGLRQPADYLRQVQAMGRADNPEPIYLLVEKILAQGEKLDASWPVHGTTGYDFISQLSGVLVDRDQRVRFTEIYENFTRDNRDYSDQVVRSKRLIIAEMFANAISNLGADLVLIVGRDRLWRDLTRHELTTAVSEFVAHLPVYRTYRRRGAEASEQERRVVEQAYAEAIADNPRADPQPFEFLRDMLVGSYPGPAAPADYRESILSWVFTFQQYTGAIMAKSVEDTAFYNYNRLIGLNEVGCDPDTFGGTIDDFHQFNAARLSESPMAMLASSTHDSKFSEDVRARLYALSELGCEWKTWVEDWREKTNGHTTSIEGKPAPDALDRYRFFQTLLGAWPLSAGEVDAAFRKRLKEHFRKCVNESKRHTSILNTNEEYLAACDRYVDAITSHDAAPDFLSSFLPCAGRIARLGMTNSLAQLVLKCTVPGIPDFYQGNEIWDFSLVDPDNRRPVDYGRRQELLEYAIPAPAKLLLENWRDGGIKLRTMRELLRLRREIPLLFSKGSYLPIRASGAFADRVVSFVRGHGSDSILVAIPRMTAEMGCPPLGQVWDDTSIGGLPRGEWRDLLTGAVFAGGEPALLRTLLADLPFAVLLSRNNPI